MNLLEGKPFELKNVDVSTDIEGSTVEYDVEGAKAGDSVLLNVIGQDHRLRFEASCEIDGKIKVKYHFNRDEDQQQDNITCNGLTLRGIIFFNENR